MCPMFISDARWRQSVATAIQPDSLLPVHTTRDFVVGAGRLWLRWKAFPTTGCLVMFVTDIHGSYSMLDNKYVSLLLQTNTEKSKYKWNQHKMQNIKDE